jgi:hypothetical protein
MAAASQHAEKAEHHSSIHKAYKALYNASLDARYQAADHWVSAADARNELISKRLEHIRSFVASHFKGERKHFHGQGP